MRRIKTLGCVLAASLGILTALAPEVHASGANLLKLEAEGSALAGGAAISAVSTEVTMANSFWSLTCTEGTLRGRVGTDLMGKDSIDPVSGGQFSDGPEGLCTSTFGFVVGFHPVQTPELLLSKTGQATLKFARFTLVPKEDAKKPENEDEACNVVANGLRGTFPVSEVPQPLTVTFAKAKTHMEPIRGAECGLESPPLFSASFTFTSHGSPVDAVLFSRHG